MSSDEGKIVAAMVLDMIGKPAEHVLESMQRVIEGINEEPGVSVKMKDIKVPTPMKEGSEFYTTFAEIEFEADSIMKLTELLFKYMPAHIEIISPEILAMSNGSMGAFLSELVRRLHAYDEVARIMQAEKKILVNKIKELGGNLEDLTPKKKADKEKKN